MDSKLDLIRKNEIYQLKQKLEAAMKENEELREAMRLLQNEAEENDIDMIASMRLFKQILKETQENLAEVKALKRQMETEKAKYIRRMDEALKEIVGDSPFE